MDPNELETLIASAFPEARVQVTGDGRHFEAVIVSEDFQGKSLIQQHRLVYQALGEQFATEAVHALSLKTYTPEEWNGLQQ